MPAAPRGWLRNPASPLWVAGIPALVTFGAMLYQIGRPSLWQDEVSTLSDTQRTLPEMFRLLGNLDIVHAAYYLFMWAEERVAGSSAVALRFPSAVGMAVAAGVIAMLGLRLVSARAGLAAGLVFAALPQVSWYGQDARDIALDTALATVASYLFIRALEPGPLRRRRLIGYGVVLAVLGLLNFFCLLLIAAHAVMLAAQLLRHRRAAAAAPAQLNGGVPDRTAAPPLLGWAVATGVAILVAAPIMVAGWQQRGQINWITPPGTTTLARIGRLIGPPWMVVALLAIPVVALCAGAVRGGQARLRRDWPSQLLLLSVPWLLLPAGLLLAASLIHPVFITRYVVFCLPALALLVGTGLAALGRVAGLVALAVVVALGLPMQAKVRAADGHGQNLRVISHFLGTEAHKGDAVYFASRYVRKIAVGYPDGYRHLRDIGLGESAIKAGEPAGVNAPAAVVRQRLRKVTRLWVIRTARDHLPALRKLGFRPVHHWTFSGGYRVVFYVRSPWPGGPGSAGA